MWVTVSPEHQLLWGVLWQYCLYLSDNSPSACLLGWTVARVVLFTTSALDTSSRNPGTLMFMQLPIPLLIPKLTQLDSIQVRKCTTDINCYSIYFTPLSLSLLLSSKPLFLYKVFLLFLSSLLSANLKSPLPALQTILKCLWANVLPINQSNHHPRPTSLNSFVRKLSLRGWHDFFPVFGKPRLSRCWNSRATITYVPKSW